MNIFITSTINILFKTGGVILLAMIAYNVAKGFYKSSYTKNKVNLAGYILAGFVVCLGVSFAIGYNDTPPCLETEYSEQGSYCVEYDDSITPKSYKDKIQSSGKFFGILFPSFLFFVYKAKRQNGLYSTHDQNNNS